MPRHQRLTLTESAARSSGPKPATRRPAHRYVSIARSRGQQPAAAAAGQAQCSAGYRARGSGPLR